MDGGKKRTESEGLGEGEGRDRKKATRPGEENWNPSGTEDDKIADGQVLL